LPLLFNRSLEYAIRNIQVNNKGLKLNGTHNHLDDADEVNILDGRILNYTWSDNKVRKLIAVKVLCMSLLNTTMVTFKVLPLGSYAPMPVPSLPFKTIFQLVLWNDLQSCRCITPDVIKMPSFQYFLFPLSLGTEKSY